MNTDTEFAEVEVLPLEKVIDNALVRENITEKVINELKERYGNMQLRSLTDKETYLDIVEAKKVVRKVGIAAEKLCKAGREEAIKTQKAWLKKQDEVLTKIAAVQDPLDAEIKKFDDEQERIAQEQKALAEQRFQTRQQSIIRLGAQWQSDSFVLAEISYEVSVLREVDDEMWNEVIFPKYKRVYDRVEAERAAEETKRREEAEKLAAQQAELLKQQEEFKQQQEAFQKQQAEMQKMKDEIELKKNQEEATRKRNKERERTNQLLALGMTYDLQRVSYKFEDVVVAALNTEEDNCTDAYWDEVISEITPKIQERKAAIEAKKKADEETAQLKAIEDAKKREIERIAAEQKQKEYEAQQEALRKAEEAAKASDSEKWAEVIKQLGVFPLPDMKSTIYKRKVMALAQKIEEIKAL